MRRIFDSRQPGLDMNLLHFRSEFIRMREQGIFLSGKSCPFGREGINLRGFHFRRPVAAKVVAALIVDENEQHVRLRSRFGLARESQLNHSQ